MTGGADRNWQPDADPLLVQMADYTANATITSEVALDTARWCLVDTLGCGLMALDFPACTKLLGPHVPGTTVPHGARVPGTAYRLDPVKAAWDIGCIVRWLDFNDTWLAAEWGHPSDNLGSILSVTDHLSQVREGSGDTPFHMRDVLDAMVRAHELQGVLALANAFNRVGLDHVILVKAASAAVAAKLLGADRGQIVDALSQVWVDGQALRTYRHAPNTGPRKSWAAGDATARAVQLAMMTMKGEPGYATALSAPKWGFSDVLFGGRPLELAQPFGSYVMENVLFKISFPAEFHAQTAAEAAVALHAQVRGRLAEIERIDVRTHESAIRIISKEGPLSNPADRDHCLQYMIAVPLAFGDLAAEHYEDDFHRDNPVIDELRRKMIVTEDPTYTREYMEPDKRAIANALQIHFSDGSCTDPVEVKYPIGHRRRRDEGIPLLQQKFSRAVERAFGGSRRDAIVDLCLDFERLAATPVNRFVDLFVPPAAKASRLGAAARG